MRFNSEPPRAVFREYFPLFCSEDALVSCPDFQATAMLGGTYDLTLDRMSDLRCYDNYDDFLSACRNETAI